MLSGVCDRLKPDELGTKIGFVVFAGVGPLVVYLAGTPGLYAAFVLTVLVAFVVGVATRSVKRVVRATPLAEEVAPSGGRFRRGFESRPTITL